MTIITTIDCHGQKGYYVYVIEGKNWGKRVEDMKNVKRQ